MNAKGGDKTEPLRCHGDASAVVYKMSHLYDTEEPNVVSEALLRECVRAQGPKGEAGRVADEEGVAFSEVRELRLDFKSESWGALLGR